MVKRLKRGKARTKIILQDELNFAFKETKRVTGVGQRDIQFGGSRVHIVAARICCFRILKGLGYTGEEIAITFKFAKPHTYKLIRSYNKPMYAKFYNGEDITKIAKKKLKERLPDNVSEDEKELLVG